MIFVIFSIVFIITFILGFAFGIAMPFILNKLGIYKQNITIDKNKQDPKTNANEIIDEWLNGKVGE